LRTVLAAVVAVGLGLASAAQADTITFNASGNQYTTDASIGSLQWNAGGAVAVASIANGAILAPGNTFQLYYQLVLSGLNDPSGNPIGGTPIAGINNTWQITEVASFTERVLTLDASNATATFVLNPVQKADTGVRIYYTDLNAAGAVKANNSTGLGFVPTVGGTLIYSATPTGVPGSTFTDSTKLPSKLDPVVALNQNPGNTNYAGTQTDQGSGSTGFTMATNGTPNPAFFKTGGLALSSFAAIGTMTPFIQVPPALLFNRPTGGTFTANVGATNGVGPGAGPFDFLLQLNGSPQSFAVPEPASLIMALSALGIVPLATWRVRSRVRA